MSVWPGHHLQSLRSRSRSKSDLDLGCDRAPATDHEVRLDLGSSEPGVRWLHGCYHCQSITVWDLELRNSALSIGRQVLYFLEDDLQINLPYTGSIVQLDTSVVSTTSAPIQTNAYQD